MINTDRLDGPGDVPHQPPAAPAPSLSAAEQHPLLGDWNRTARDYPPDQCLHQLFEEQVSGTPAAVAVGFQGQSLTYRELNRRANQLAHHLRSLGVGPDVLVGLCLERSLQMVVAFVVARDASTMSVVVLRQWLADLATYNESVACRLSGRVDRQRLRQALQVVMERHEVLRTALVQQGQNPVQQVAAAKDVSLPWQAVDLQALAPGQQPLYQVMFVLLEAGLPALRLGQAEGRLVPLDPALPQARLAFLVSAAGCAVVLTQKSHLAVLEQNPPAGGAAPVFVVLAAVTLESRLEGPGNLVPLAAPQHLAYVLYTSGSTGQPKGVEMPHRALVNLLHWQLATSALRGASRTLQFASLGFDVSFQEMFSTWLSGGTLVLIAEFIRQDPAALWATIIAERIERLFLPFVMLEQLAETAGPSGPLPVHLKEVAVAGEQLRLGPGLRNFFSRMPDCRLWNHYGPTEAHVVTSHELAGPPAAGSVPDKPELTPPPAVQGQFHPLSPGQFQLWFLERLEPGSALYILPLLLRLRGPLNLAALKRSLTELVRRHAPLRTVFRTENHQPQACILPVTEVPLEVLALAADAPDREQEGRRRAEAFVRQPFDLATGPVFRAGLLGLRPDDHLLALAMHHIVADGWSLELIQRDLAHCYGCLRHGREPDWAPLPMPFAEHVAWQQQQLGPGERARQLAYWRQQLAGVPPRLELPLDRPRPGRQAHLGAAQSVVLAKSLTQDLKRLAQAHDATLFLVLLSALEVLLQRLSGQEDFVVGAPVSGRRLVETQEVVGFFMNSLPLRANVAGAPTFLELLQRCRETFMQASENQGVPLHQVVTELQTQRDLSQTPLFQVCINHLSYERKPGAFAGLETQSLAPAVLDAKFDLTLYLEELGGRLKLEFVYDRHLFDAARMAEMARQLESLLKQVVSCPERRIQSYLLPPPTAHTPLPVTIGPWPAPWTGSLAARFQAQAQRTPNAEAVVLAKHSLTYGELQARSDQMAHYLRRLGVGPEVMVGLYLERSLDLVVALLAVLKAGGALVPLEPDLPTERIAFILADTQLPWLLTQSSLLGKLPATGAQRLCLDQALPALPAAVPGAAAGATVKPEHLAYVIYTSGSTGRPKGVLISQAAYGNYCAAAIEYWQLNASDRVLQFARLGFDVSLDQLLTPLLAGATVVLRATEIWAPALFTKVLQAHRLTVVHLPAAYWQKWVETLTQDTAGKTLGHLRLLQVGGDVMPVAAVRRWRELQFPSVRLINRYGPTETTMFTTAYEVPAQPPPQASASRIPIGRTVGPRTLHLLDAQRNPVPAGATGEIYIGGQTVARGYLNRPELTASHFLPDPFSGLAGARLYKTGDLGRLLPDGNLDFLGRADLQVKLRGYRIELGEIEAVLGGHPEVAACAVVAQARGGGDPALVAFFVRRTQADLATESLRRWLGDKLPDYMVPARFLPVAVLPLNPSGKVDRKALEHLDAGALPSARAFVAPRNEREREIAELWQAVLRREPVGVQDNFFELGGHSLLAVVICSQLGQRLGLEVPLRWLFEHPTIEQLAKRLTSRDEPPNLRRGVTADLQQSVPMSFGQQRLWLLQQTLPEAATYNQPTAWRLSGPVERAKVQRALVAILARHAVLRTALVQQAGNLVQAVSPATAITLPWREVDLRAVPPDRQPAALADRLLTEARQPFDLAQAPLWRALWVELGGQERVLAFTFHHSVVDAWSKRLFFRELECLYAADGLIEPARLPDLPIQYADYAAEQRRRLTGQRLEAQQAYWRTQLQELPPALALPTDGPRPRQPSGRGATHPFRLTGRVVTQLRQLARAQETTLFTVVLAAFRIWLHRYTGQNDLVVGTPMTGRDHPEVQALIGFFLNTLPIRGRVAGDQSFRAVVQQERKTLLAAFSHAELPFEQMVALAVKEREPGQQPLYQAMFVLLEQGACPLRLAAAQSQPVPMDTRTSKCDLTLSVQATEPAWDCQFEYATDRFTEVAMARMARHFAELLRALAQEPQRQVRQLRLMPAAERAQILTAWNRTEREYPREKCLPQLFEAQVRQTPDAVAAVFGPSALSYRELNARANQLGHHLRSLGVGPEVLVGLCVERSLDLVVAALAILKAGGAYVPLDPAFPRERLAFLIQDAALPVMIAQRRVAERVGNPAVQVVWLDDFVWPADAENLPVIGPATALAYVIYTSGSTGQPKGVEISHRALVNCLCHFQRTLDVRPHDGWLAVTTLSFDIAGLEIWLPLLAGARVIIAPREIALDGRALNQTLLASGATILQATPTHWQGWLHSGWQGNPQLQILCGGEALPQELADRLAVLGARAWNLYGPTETTIWSTAAPLLPRARVHIGVPLANTQVRILDPQGQPVPIGVTGELCIGGDGLARGYRNRPDLTAERFIPDPFSRQSGARLYRTGDLARWRSDGNLECLGRTDQQVKLRGYRIELGEIEAVLGAHPEVQSCAVVTQDRGAGDKVLVAFLVGRNAGSAALPALRQWLAEKLPDFMIPARFLAVESLPLSPNGKLDRLALATLAGAELTLCTDYVAPRTATEAALTRIWSDLLGLDQVGVQDNFFTLGGHSLQAMLMGAQIKRLLGVDVPLRWLFEQPTIARLAQRMTSGEGQPDISLLAKADRQQPLPLSFAQQGMWLLQQTLPDTATYNQSVAWRLSGPVDRARLQRALVAIQTRHEVLRTALVQQGTDLVQLISAATATSLPWQQIDLQPVPPDRQPPAWAARLLAEADRPFDLAQAPLWRIVCAQVGAEDRVLLFTFHHSIMDEWSQRLFFGELEALYAADGQPHPAQLPELPVQYADFTVWQRQRLTGQRLELLKNYWRAQLLDLPVLDLPGDLSRPPQPTGRGAGLQFRLDGAVVTRFRALAREETTTLFTVVLSAFAVWLHRYTGQADLVVGTPITHRERPELQSLLGFFLNTLPIRVRLAGHPTFRAVLRQVRESLLGAFSHADLPFQQMVELAVKERAPEQQPLYRTMFVLLEEELTGLHLAGAEARVFSLGTRTSKSDLILSITAVGEIWDCQLAYATDLFTAEAAGRMAGHLAELFHSISENPESPIGQLQLLPEAERHRVLVEWNRTQRDYPRDKCVHQLFAEQVDRAPDAVAVVFDGQSLTYGALNERADRLAAHLQIMGVAPGALVALRVERSFEMIIGVLAILKAGGAYWALEENQPTERCRRLLGEAQPRVLLARRNSLNPLSDLTRQPATDSPAARCTVAAIEDLLESAPPGARPATPPPRAEDPAYVNYTSGSTGQPKGVVVPHRAVVRLVRGTDYVSLGADETLLHLSPLSFDASTFELWGALLNGGRVVLLPPGPPTLASIGQAIRHQGVTTLWLTAGLFHLMVEARLDDLKPLRQLLAGGDVLAPEHVVKARRALPGCRIVNGYGPTENTTFTCCYTVGDEQALTPSVPIGRPIANTQVYVLDPDLQPVPVGVAGELCAGGDGVACGYLHQPRLTAERFIPDPFSTRAGARLYRTGDWVRWRPDGNLEFLGRVDSQVKLRGFRVELGEIETALRALPEVRAATAILREDLPGDKRLVAYLVAKTGDRPAPSHLRARLGELLPDHMLPNAFVWLDQLPLTPQGKVDRNALPAPHVRGSHPAGEAARPLNLLELELIRIWQQLFQREDIGRHANFFALGGHSLLAVRLAAAIDTILGCKFPIAALFQSPTIALLARHLTEKDWVPPWGSLVPLQPQGSQPALFFVHGAGGDVFGFLGLARLLGPEQPSYGIQAVGLDGRSPRHVTVEEMAAHYVKEILSFQPAGPVFLAGYSMGGLLAFAVAQELHRLGRRVALLALLDSAPIGAIPWAVYALAMASHLPSRCRFHLRRWWELPLRERFRYLCKRWASLRYWLVRNRAQSPPVTAPPPQDTQPSPLPGFVDYYHAVAYAYRLRPYPGSVEVFVSDQANAGWRWFWRYMARGGVSFHRVPGGHFEILSADHLPVLAEALTAALKNAREKQPTTHPGSDHTLTTHVA